MCVNPNFSNRIIGRLSDRILSDLISADDGVMVRAKRRRMTVRIFILRVLRLRVRLGVVARGDVCVGGCER